MPEISAAIKHCNPSSYELYTTCTKVKAERSALLAHARALLKSEIAALEEQGNRADDWSSITVAEDFSPRFLHNNTFYGTCYLGVFSGSPTSLRKGITLPTGIFSSAVHNSVIATECSIHRCAHIANYFIESSVTLFNCGILVCDPAASFGNGETITIGNETGGRQFPLFAEMTIDDATAAATNNKYGIILRQFIDAYLSAVQAGFGIICSYTTVVNCPSIVNAFIGQGARINNATTLENVTILSSNEEPAHIATGAIIRNSCLQWGSSVETLAIVETSLITEHAHVERHGKVTSSIIGPNTGIAEGEVTSCLVGPFVGFHHQALLIGTLWPEGKGNVAYGANVGSNHTAKAPDQELYSGEGMFYGLGVNIKFPADFKRAPYSIIATGVTTLPQRMTFPFSLINTPSLQGHGLSPAINELLPAWVLSDNLFLIKRSEAKFASRNKATRTTIPLTVFRPDIIDLMITAKNTLLSIPHQKDIYTEADIPGIGKNYVTRASVHKAITTYREHIEWYCLEGMLRYLQQTGYYRGIASLFSLTTTDNAWEHCRLTAISEGYALSQPIELLDRLSDLREQMMQALVDSKRKDAIRGRTIMGDYDQFHQPIEEEPFIVQALAQHRNVLQEIQQVKTMIVASKSNEETSVHTVL